MESGVSLLSALPCPAPLATRPSTSDFVMPFLFTCPHCQTKTQVDDRYSGQSGNCVTCGGPIQLPRFAAGATQRRRVWQLGISRVTR